ncbi:MAG: hypothetical protein ACTSRP_02940 [Candidatus Helarchaeota archaeon]
MKDHIMLKLFGMIGVCVSLIIILFGGIKNPSNFRLISDIIQNTLISIFMLFLFFPDNKKIRDAIYLGTFVMVFDFILESIAVKFDWWYSLGGTTFPPIIIVPLEMIVGFFFLGFSFYFIFDIPVYLVKIRSNYSLIKFFTNLAKKKPIPHIFRITIVFLNAIIGTNGDLTAGEEIWKMGPGWAPIYTFFIWLIGGLITLSFYYFLQNKKTKIEP